MLTLTKISGVLFVQDSNNTNPKSYFGASGSFQASDDNAKLTIKIGDDVYSLIWQDLQVGTSTPTSISQAKTLLNAILGT